MEELFELTGRYNLTLSFDEEQKTIYASTSTATSILSEDIEKIKELTGAEKAEIYADHDQEENFLIRLPLPKGEIKK